MTKIAAQAEKDKMEENDIPIRLTPGNADVTGFLAKSAVRATNLMPIHAIITDSFSGLTARSLAAYRGKHPVLAICYKEKTMRHLALSYGVEAIYMPEKANGMVSKPSICQRRRTVRNITSLLFANLSTTVFFQATTW